MVLAPTARLIVPDADPEVTGVPLTVTVAVGSITVGIAVIDDTLLATVAV